MHYTRDPGYSRDVGRAQGAVGLTITALRAGSLYSKVMIRKACGEEK